MIVEEALVAEATVMVLMVTMITIIIVVRVILKPSSFKFSALMEKITWSGPKRQK